MSFLFYKNHISGTTEKPLIRQAENHAGAHEILKHCLHIQRIIHTKDLFTLADRKARYAEEDTEKKQKPYSFACFCTLLLVYLQ